MEAGQCNILDLNDYCLGNILKYLKIEDHVNFGGTCSRFRAVLRDWSYVLYPEFEIAFSFDNESDAIKWQLKLFAIVCDVIKSFYLEVGPIEEQKSLKEQFVMDKFCNNVKRMQKLQYFALSMGSAFQLISKTNKSIRCEMVEKAFCALEELPKLKSVSVKYREHGFKASSLMKLHCLQEISIDTKIAAEDLVEICKSNRSLRVLWLRQVVGEPKEIVPHCRHLEEIAFPMLPDHTSYVDLADLPNLRKVTIKSTNSISPCAKLFDLLSAFAARQQESPLESLVLLSSLSREETSELIQLRSLKELVCVFEDASCIDLLAELTNLEGLYIILGRSTAGANECLNVLKSCKKLQRLHIVSNLGTDFVIKALDVLRQVRNPEKQRPLQLYSTGVMHLCNDEEEKLVDNSYCTIVNHSEYLRALPWRFAS